MPNPSFKDWLRAQPKIETQLKLLEVDPEDAEDCTAGQFFTGLSVVLLCLAVLIVWGVKVL